MTEQETESKDVVITYDTLFEILRNEKTKEDLQKLDKGFFRDVVNYLNDKQNNAEDTKDQQSLFEVDEKEKKLHQIKNIKRILKDIYEKREKKIIEMALNKSRFGSNLIDTSALLDEERLFYEMMISLLNNQRDSTLKKLLKGEIPGDMKLDAAQPVAAEEAKEEFESAAELAEKKEAPEQSEDSTKLVRFLAAVPQFMGEDMLEYGPYDEEDVSKLPSKIADVLIEKERAEEIKEG